MSEAIKKRGRILGTVLKFFVSGIAMIVTIVFSLPFALIGQKENKLLGSVKNSLAVPTVHASDQFACGCCCCTTDGGGGAIPGCACGGGCCSVTGGGLSGTK